MREARTEHKQAVVYGVMDEQYAKDRQTSLALQFRYQVRAQLAVNHLHARLGEQASYRVLDLGCAEARTLLLMRELLGGMGEYHGVEMSDKLLAMHPTLPCNVQLINGNASDLPPEIPDRHYDLCTALALLEHLPVPEEAAREAFRILRPGGVFVATCPNPFWDLVADKLNLVDEARHQIEMDARRMENTLLMAGFGRIEYRRFMLAPVGALPYAHIRVPPKLSLKLDAWINKLGFFESAFVNQIIIGQVL